MKRDIIDKIKKISTKKDKKNIYDLQMFAENRYDEMVSRLAHHAIAIYEEKRSGKMNKEDNDKKKIWIAGMPVPDWLKEGLDKEYV